MKEIISGTPKPVVYNIDTYFRQNSHEDANYQYFVSYKPNDFSNARQLLVPMPGRPVSFYWVTIGTGYPYSPEDVDAKFATRKAAVDQALRNGFKVFVLCSRAELAWFLNLDEIPK